MAATSPPQPFGGARQLDNSLSYTHGHDFTTRFHHPYACQQTCHQSFHNHHYRRRRAVSLTDHRLPGPAARHLSSPQDLARSQAKQSPLAKAAMSNQQAATSTTHASRTGLPPPFAPTSAPSSASTQPNTTTQPTPAHLQSSPVIAVQPDPSDVKPPGPSSGALTPISIDESHLTPPQGSPR
ncbi:hypothetical protein Micbo1qcDRAFT_155658, partial [Microdochium bolleyi]